MHCRPDPQLRLHQPSQRTQPILSWVGLSADRSLELPRWVAAAATAARRPLPLLHPSILGPVAPSLLLLLRRRLPPLLRLLRLLLLLLLRLLLLRLLLRLLLLLLLLLLLPPLLLLLLLPQLLLLLQLLQRGQLLPQRHQHPGHLSVLRRPCAHGRR